jgi:hypothetical protein
MTCGPGRKKSGDKSKFIVVARAEDEDLARQYYKVLRYYRVPAQITSQGSPNRPYDTIISVPNEYYEKAYSLITERMPGDSFIDMLFMPIEEFVIDEQENPNQAA